MPSLSVLSMYSGMEWLCSSGDSYMQHIDVAANGGVARKAVWV